MESNNTNTSSSRPQMDPSVDRLARLANDIEQNTRVLTSGLARHRLGAPSFQPDGLADFPLGESDAEMLRARSTILSLTEQLHQLLLGPRELLKLKALDVVNFVSLQAIHAFQIPQAMPATGATISYAKLAEVVRQKSGFAVPASELQRIIRLAMTNSIFCEPGPGLVAHNRTSLALLEDEALTSWLGFYTADLFHSVGHTVAAMQKWPGSRDPTKTAVNIAFGHDDTFFHHIQADAELVKRYAMAMRAHSSREGFEVAHTVNSYPWDKLGKATIVDMGGNDGYVATAIAQKFPSLSFIVQDLAKMRGHAEIPATLSDRIKLTTHDFYKHQPVVAEAYLLRHVLHALSDQDALRALRALIPALQRGARVIVNDVVLPEPGSVSVIEERTLRQLDVLMKTVCNGRERTADDWKKLFAEADARFVWRACWRSSGSLFFIETEWDNEGV